MFGMRNTMDEERNHGSLLQLSRNDGRVGDSIAICRKMSTTLCARA